jgi:hypothetical protein
MIDIERLASEAGFTVYNGCCDGITADLKRFAALVRNEVLEEAAKAAETESVDAEATGHPDDLIYNSAVAHCMVAIRALKDKT